MQSTILLIEDDPFVARSIQQVLSEQYKVDTRRDLATSYQYLTEKKPALIVLDRKLPDGDGIELLEHVSQNDYSAPLLVVSAKNMVHDRIEGLRKGADDYLSKPFSTTELRLRIEKLLSTTKHQSAKEIIVGPLHLLVDRGHVIVENHLLRLRRKEFQILSCLAKQKGRVVSRDQLINQIWPDGVIPSHATIDVYIRRLRMMLGKYGSMVTTMKGYGYVLLELNQHPVSQNLPKQQFELPP
jgi:two-component system, OmpR family, response regulator